MGQLLQFPAPRPNDSGKARIRAHRKAFGLAADRLAKADSLIMDHADPADTRPSELA
jgi:hypothetical protein